MSILIKRNQIKSFKIDDSTTINRYNFANKDYDIVEIIVNGKHGTMLNKNSTKTYCITSGFGTFEIDGKPYPVENGDIISVEPGSWLTIHGEQLNALLIANPPFNPDDEEWE